MGRRIFHGRLFHRLFHGGLRRLFHAYLICSQLVCCSNYLVCSQHVLCSADVVSNAYVVSSNVVHAIVPSTANGHREESVFERGEQRGGEAKEEKNQRRPARRRPARRRP